MQLMQSLQEAFALLLPVSCAGCGASDVALCHTCRDELRPSVQVRTAHGVRVASGLQLTETSRAVLRAIKRDHRTSLIHALVPAVTAALDVATIGAPRCALVPIPPTKRAMRRRGFDTVKLLARGAHVPVVSALTYARTPDDQRGLSELQRVHNMHDAFSVRARALVGVPAVIIFDDVVTTGATIGAATRALERAGIPVFGAITAVSTPKVNSTEKDT